MALADTSTDNELSQLSAEAASFVPADTQPPAVKIKPVSAASPGRIRKKSRASPPNVVQIQQLPKYMTNCYPFVTVDPGFTPLTRPVTHASGIRMPEPTMSMCLQTRPYRHRNKNVSVVNVPVSAAQFNAYPPPGYVRIIDMPNPQSAFLPVALTPYTAQGNSPSPPFSSAIPMPDSEMVISGTGMPQMNNYLPYPPQAGVIQWLSPAIPPPSIPPQGYIPAEINAAGPYNPVASMLEKKAKDAAAVRKQGPRTKVIVCRESSCQTDFNDELARLSLSEKPNPFYIGEGALVSDNNESDSGYSSPQHKQTATNTMPQGTSGIESNISTSTRLPAPILVPPREMPNMSVPPPMPYMTDGMLRAAFQYITSTPMQHVQKQLQFMPPRNLHPQYLQQRFVPEYQNVRPMFTPPSNLYRPPPDHAYARRPFNRPPRFPSPPRAMYVTARELQSTGPKHLPGRSQAAGPTQPSGQPVGQEQPALPFGDVDEFPILLSAAGGLVALHGASCQYSSPSSSTASMNASTIRPSVGHADNLNTEVHYPSKQRKPANRVVKQLEASAVSSPLKNIPGLFLTDKELKTARKKLKRLEIANRAAEKELAEISLEQQVLRELRVKHVQPASDKESVLKRAPSPPAASSALSQQADGTTMSSITEKQDETFVADLRKDESMENVENNSEENLNLVPCSVDASLRRWKEKENPKGKKPSTLKKVILKEREEKKRHKQVDDDDDLYESPSLLADGETQPVEHIADTVTGHNGSPPSGDLSPVSQMSPFNMSPMSGSPAGSAGVSPIAGNGMLGVAYGPGSTSIAAKIHSRRFREYCNQVLDKEIDDCCTRLLQDLVLFQNPGFGNDPSKIKRRIVMGLREVTKHLKLNQLKCIIISPNMERIQSKGGLDEALNNIIDMSRQQNVPFVFALGRRALGRVCAKLVPVSIVGIFCYEGTEDNFRQLCKLTEKARRAYNDMVVSLEQEMISSEAPTPVSNSFEKETSASVSGSTRGPLTGNLGGFEKLFPHLGHSRTPSACSAISIISSVLSEPVSENYPASDPDMDVGRGHEAKDAAGGTGRKITDLDTVGESREEGPDGLPDCCELARDHIDDGHEADTEDDCESRSSRVRRHTIASRAGSTTDRIKSECSSERDRSVKAAGKPPTVESVLAEPSALVVEHPVSVLRSPAIDSKRIETWVVESQRAIENMRSKSSTAPTDSDDEEFQDIDSLEPVSRAELDKLTGSVNAKDNEDIDKDLNDVAIVEDDVGSMKTVDEGSSSESSQSNYVDACVND